ncbi:metal ABC transporter permease [Acholeplasma hippikon]|uniref:High-affinity zinc uptake system membrane protein znuB n=1 Tax=Acholeplasma hippikon TaxID=264636 RepID=A0A449BLE5_9MOLU|nr:metal ABC transporter permease [Acholeplasma hippikon]VEU83260.1 High-affinity zinc uptake system membrane protein znuB [Acholeplasma hippikon]
MDNLLFTLDVLKYGIMVVILLGLTASILSPFVVLNEQSLIADGLAHVSFTALAIGMFFSNEPFFIALPIVVLASILVKWISQHSKVNGDAALGMVSSVGFAIGLIVIKYASSAIELESLISGNLWLRNLNDVLMSLILFVIALVFIIVNYRKLLSLTFDFDYSKFMKVKSNLLSYVLAAITGLFVVIGVRSIGVLLISSLLIFPVLTANLFAKSFKSLFLNGSIISSAVILVGIFSAHVLNLPAGSVIVIVYAIVFIACNMILKIRGNKNG